MRGRVAENAATPAATLAELARDPDWPVRRQVAENAATPGAALAELARDQDWPVRRGVAGNAATPAAALAELARDQDWQVRGQVAGKAATPGATLGPGSRWRSRMLRITSAEWTPSDSAWTQAFSTAGNPSVSTAARILTICRSPLSDPASLRRTRSNAASSTQSLNGAPLRRAPGLRARTGT